jgi:predicted MPP superfamily phosphohydrolase
MEPVADVGETLWEIERRLGRTQLQERLRLETEYEQRTQRFGTRFFHVDNWYSVHSVIRNSLRLVGLHSRAQRNARAVTARDNDAPLRALPRAFDGYTILQISDPHLDMHPDVPQVLIDCVRNLNYDLCVLTGDYRTRTFGPCEPTLLAMAQLRPHIKSDVYAVLGNHDSVRMVPEMEALGIRVLLNESVMLERAGAALYLAGIEDAHYYRLHDVDKAAREIPDGAAAVLLSHTPEAYANAQQAGFDFMLCGHTHGGQICLPGGFPLITDTENCPRRYTRGVWRHQDMLGYTSVGSGTSIVDVRLNCPPEVTLHRLRCVT